MIKLKDILNEELRPDELKKVLSEDILNELDADKSKKYVKKATDKFHDALFAFEHSYPLKLIAKKDRTLTNMFNALVKEFSILRNYLKKSNISEAKLKDTLTEAQADFSIDSYKIADSFTSSELTKLKADGKISAEVYNGATEIQRIWKKNHPTMRIGNGAYRKEILKKLK